MNLSKYQKLAARTECDQSRARLRMMGGVGEAGSDLLLPIRLNHAVLGAAGEIGELSAAIEKWIYYGKPLDMVNFKEEVGDTLWYLSLAANAMGVDLGEIAEANIAKLRIRFPDKFTEEKASTRDLVSERKILEQYQCGAQPKPNTAIHKIPNTTLKDEEGILTNIEQDGHGFGHVGPSEYLDDDPKPREF